MAKTRLPTELMVDQTGPPLDVEARRKSMHRPDRPIRRRTQQKRSGIRDDRIDVEGRNHFTIFNRRKSE
jgi:ribulose 1,5-bisphosphate carboxylase large subunit-like protein